MKDNERQQKQDELAKLRARVAELESELADDTTRWQGTGYYATYYATSGFMLGMIAGAASLIFNVIGAVLTGNHPLKLIQVYLTFPMGERGLTMESGIALTVGCCLYLGTGMILGVPFYLLLTYLTEKKTFTFRIIIASVLAISMWAGHFYLVLAWLQPLLFGGNWIVEQIPIWVAALTHLVFGWTMALLYPYGLYTPYRLQTDTAPNS